MTNDLILQNSWGKRYWKWLLVVIVIIFIAIIIFFSSGMNGIAKDMAQAYVDTALYDNALKRANSNERVFELMGEIQPIDKLAILEGQVAYSNDNQFVNSTIRVVGIKRVGKLDISAQRINSNWRYNKINIRFKNFQDESETIEVIQSKLK